MTRLEQAKLFLDFYFAPWGAAKGEVWGDVSFNKPFNDETAAHLLEGILSGGLLLSEEDIRSMKIVTG